MRHRVPSITRHGIEWTFRNNAYTWSLDACGALHVCNKTGTELKLSRDAQYGLTADGRRVLWIHAAELLLRLVQPRGALADDANDVPRFRDRDHLNITARTVYWETRGMREAYSASVREALAEVRNLAVGQRLVGGPKNGAA
jgi:hypothetical protein